MSATLTVAVDAMSGDAGASVIIESAEIVLKQHKDVHLILVGDEQELEQCLVARPPTCLAGRDDGRFRGGRDATEERLVHARGD